MDILFNLYRSDISIWILVVSVKGIYKTNSSKSYKFPNTIPTTIATINVGPTPNFMPVSNSSSWLYSVGHTKATGQGFLLTGAPVVDVCSWLDCVVDGQLQFAEFVVVATNEFADVAVEQTGQFTGVVVEHTGHVGQFADVVVVANEFAGVVVEQTGHVGQFADVTVGQFTGVIVGQFTGACVGVVVGTVKFNVQASFL